MDLKVRESVFRKGVMSILNARCSGYPNKITTTAHISNIYIPVGSALRDLISARGQLNNGLGRIMHSPSARALSALDRYLIIRAH